MIEHKNKTKNNSGSALAYTLVIMSVSLIILVSLLGYVSSQLKFGLNRVEKQKAFQISEAGIFFYRWYLAHQTSGKTAQEVDDFWQSGTALGIAEDYENEFKDPNGTALGKYRIHVEQPDSGSTIVIAQSTGWTYKMPEITKTVQVRFRRPSWSENVVLANDFMRFGEGTDVYGQIHSNRGMRFDGTAHNVVTSSVATLDDPDHTGGNEFGVHTHRRVPPATGTSASGLASEAPPTDPVPTRSDVFFAGRQFPVSEISFTGVSSDLTLIKKTACDYNEGTHTCTVVNNCTSDGCYFNTTYPRRIILKSNGTMDVCRISSYDTSSYSIASYRRNSGGGTCTSCSGQCAPTTYNIPDNGVIFVENNLWIEGAINSKRITIAAANISGGASADIYIGKNNLSYTNFDGQDIIGLIAQNNISVIRDSLDFLTIDGALLAQLGRVGRNYYSDNHKNTITVNGSLATNLRYGFAYTDGTGYTNRILNFDNNLLYYPPPYFPTGTEYAIDLWEEL
jgi:hypothetical protein